MDLLKLVLNLCGLEPLDGGRLGNWAAVCVCTAQLGAMGQHAQLDLHKLSYTCACAPACHLHKLSCTCMPTGCSLHGPVTHSSGPWPGDL